MTTETETYTCLPTNKVRLKLAFLIHQHSKNLIVQSTIEAIYRNLGLDQTPQVGGYHPCVVLFVVGGLQQTHVKTVPEWCGVPSALSNN
jgi:hypothetical protein